MNHGLRSYISNDEQQIVSIENIGISLRLRNFAENARTKHHLNHRSPQMASMVDLIITLKDQQFSRYESAHRQT